MLDSTGLERHFPIAVPVSLRRPRRCRPHDSHQPLQSSRGHGSRWPGRAALCVDRPRYGHHRRLGYATSLRTALVREAGSFLLVRGYWIQIGSSARMGRAAALSIGRPRSGRHHLVAGLEALSNRI
jgi:hypothetical protein